MKIVRESLIEGAQRAQGLAIIIDVFRAFTVTPIFFYHGAKKVIFVRNPEEAFSLKTNHDDIVLAGEVNEQLIPGFDLGNSPSELIRKPKGFLKGKIVVQKTTAGVTGVISALERVGAVILGSYGMARAISAYIRSQDPLPKVLTIVAMGTRGAAKAPEDEGCAAYLEHLLIGIPYNHLDTLKAIIFNETAQKFIRGDKAYLPREDPIICLQRDLFDFVLVANKEQGLVTVTKRTLDD
jgi:2-phosphosulfolactate phosphatase